MPDLPNEQIPRPEDVLLSAPLYSNYQITKQNVPDVLRVEFYQGTLDTFCLGCGTQTVYRSLVELPDTGSRVVPLNVTSIEEIVERYQRLFIRYGAGQIPVANYAFTDRKFSLEFACSRNANHVLDFIFRVHSTVLTKIGQFPSLADLQANDTGKYRKALGAEKLREYNKGVGLAAHGVGIGSFVYLRRIFEEQIEVAHRDASQTPGWSEEEYHRSRMDEKIGLLHDFLPEFLVENRGLYGVLSKGVHELSEQECLQHFPVVRLAVEMILDERLDEIRKAEQKAEAARAIASLRQKLT